MSITVTRIQNLKNPKIVLAFGLISCAVVIYGYKLSHPPNYLNKIGLHISVQHFSYQSQDWLWGILYVKAQLSKAELQRYLATVIPVKVNRIPKHRTIIFNKLNYSNHFINGDEGFFPPYSTNVKGGEFQIRNTKGTRFYCKYLYVPVQGNNSYLLYLKAIPSEGA